MKITLHYLEELVAVMKKLEEVDSATGDLYTVGPVIFKDGDGSGTQQFHIEYHEDGFWVLDTEQSEDIT